MSTDLATSETPIAERINAAHRRCETSMRDGLRHAMETGRLLAEAKSKLKHGGWEKWIEDNTDVPIRLAQRYMQVARMLPELEAANAAHVSHLSFRDALLLVAQSGKRVLGIEPDRRERVLQLAEKSDGSTMLVKIARADIEDKFGAPIKASDAALLKASYPASWVASNWDMLAKDAEGRSDRHRPSTAD